MNIVLFKSTIFLDCVPPTAEVFLGWNSGVHREWAINGVWAPWTGLCTEFWSQQKNYVAQVRLYPHNSSTAYYV